MIASDHRSGWCQPPCDLIKHANAPYHPPPHQASHLITSTTSYFLLSSIRTARTLLSSLWMLPPATSGWIMSLNSCNDPIPKKNWPKRNFSYFSVNPSNGSIRSIKGCFDCVYEPMMLLGTAVTVLSCCAVIYFVNPPSQPTLSHIHYHRSTGYDFEHINKKRTGEQMSAHAQKYCELLIHHVAEEDDEWGDRSLLTFSGWIESEAGASELSRGYYLEQIKRWLQVIDRRLVRANNEINPSSWISRSIVTLSLRILQYIDLTV